MKADRFSKALGNIREDYILEAENYQVRKSRSTFRWVAAAVFTIIISLTGLAVGVEATQYKQAQAFFAKYELETENLSRSEMIRIYRDITSNRFKYDETAKLVLQSTERRVDGFQVKGDTYSQEELRNLWELYGSWPTIFERNVEVKKGVTYEIDNLYPDKENFDNHIGVIRKFQDGQLSWEIQIPGILVDYNYLKIENEYICIYDSDHKAQDTAFYLIGPNGTILFQRMIGENDPIGYIHSVTVNDHSLVLITYHKKSQAMGFYEYDLEGNLLKSATNELPYKSGYNKVVRLSDGYLVRVGNYPGSGEDESAMIAKLDMDGNLVAIMEYASDDVKYYIKNIIEYNGKLYLSVNESPVGQRFFDGENSIWEEILEQSGYFNANTLVPTAITQEYYNATLLVCDAATLELETFYTVEGALGSRLLVNADGNLEWYVEKIASVFVPLSNIYRVCGYSDLYLYEFDTESTMIGYADTGTDVVFAK